MGNHEHVADPVEAELIRQLDRRRDDLLVRAETWSRSVGAMLDPRARVQKRSLWGVLGSLAPGLLGWLLPSKRSGKARIDPDAIGSSIKSMAGELLRDLGPGFLMSLAANLLRPTKPAASAAEDEE
jgi:hypothetical protein